MAKENRCQFFDFRGAQAPPAVASRDGGIWCKKVVETTSSAVVVKTGSGGAMELTLSADNEVQSGTLYTGDVLPYDIDDIRRVTIWAKLTASLNAAISGAFGLASAQNATLNSIAANAWFHFNGSNAIVVETDDGTNDNDDKATGFSLSTTYRRFVIDFATGVKTVSPPSASLGGKGNVLFSMSDDNGSLRPVARNTSFDMSNYSSNLQLFAQIQKTAVAAGATLSILGFEIEYAMPNC